MLVDLPANIVPVLLGHFGGRAAILTKQLLKSALDFVVLFEELGAVLSASSVEPYWPP